MDEYLNAPGRVGYIDEMALPHFAVRRDPAGHPFLISLHKSFTGIGDAAGEVEALAIRLPPFLAKSEHFWARVLKRGVGLFNNKRNKKKKGGKKNSHRHESQFCAEAEAGRSAPFC